jgi:hypothetical protein
MEEKVMENGAIKKFSGGDRFVYKAFSQYCAAPLVGDEVVVHSPHPEAPGNSAATFSIVPTRREIEIPTEEKEVLRLMSRMAWALGGKDAIGNGDFVSVVKLPTDVEGEEQFLVKLKREP